MQLRRMAVLFIVISCLTGDLFAQDVEPDVNTPEETQPTSDTTEASLVGIGTVGYGSPIKSDVIMSGEIMSSRSGYFHPFLSVGGFHTDNLFLTDNDEKSDNVVVITPGIWVALPASNQKLADINTMNTAPGGLALSRFSTETERRFQGYALYRADIREHDKYTDENRVDQRGEGMFKVSLRGGLSLELLDVYEINRDPYGTGGTPDRRLDKFTSNYFGSTLAYQLSPKLRLRADYSHYYLDYDADRNEFRNREDNGISGYVFYQITPKTSLFVQAEYIDIDYDENINSDSDEMNYYLGAQMRTSAKTRGLLRIGYGNKDYDQSGIDDRDEWLAEGQFDYFFTPKTSIYFIGSRRVLETDTLGANSILTYRTQLGYRQRFTAKLRGEMGGYYIDEEYKDPVTIALRTDEREDKKYGFVASVGFTPVKWFNVSLGYEYEERDSNFDTEGYRANTVFFRLTAAL